MIMNIIKDTNEINITKVIVHVIDVQQHAQAEKSQNNINVNSMDSKVQDFIKEHIRYSVNNNESRLARFEQRGTNVQFLINQMILDPQAEFVINSKRLADELFAVTPATATPGCIVIVLFDNNHEDMLAIIKLDKNEAISYELNNGIYDLVIRGNALPLPTRQSKLHKFALVRNTDTISDEEWDSKPGLIVLDKQVASFSLFFFKEFLNAQFLLTNAHKSEKFMEGVVKYLKSSPELELLERVSVMQRLGDKIIDNEEFTVDDAARQVLSTVYKEPELLESEVAKLERVVLEQGIGDTNLRGENTTKVEKLLGTIKIKTMENIIISVPREHYDVKIEIKDSENGEGKDIIIKSVQIKQIN